MMKFLQSYLPGIIISLAFLIAGILTLSDYGLATDQVFHMLRGQAYLHLLTTGSATFDMPDLPSPVLIVPGQRIGEFRLNDWENADQPISKITYPQKSLQQNFKDYLASNNIRSSFYKNNFWSAQMHMNSPKEGGHPPVSDILAAASNNIFYERLGILSDIDAYNFYVLLTGSLAIFLVYYFTFRNFGPTAAIIASFSLALYPFFFSESHFNLKDIPEMTYFAGVIVSFYFWVLSNKKKWFAALVVFSFLAVGTKFNALFLPVILLPWLLMVRKTAAFKKWFKPSLILYTLIFILLVSSLFVLFWPYLWGDTLGRILQVLGFYKDVGTDELSGYTPFKTIFGINLLGLILVFATMPAVTLVLFTAGLIKSIRKINPAVLIVFLWFAIPVLRTMAPGSSLFASLRQFNEFLPAAAILAGIGGAFILSNLKFKIFNFQSIFKNLNIKNSIQILNLKLKITSGLLITAYVAYLLLINISLHPNENLYFNFFVGGLKGAEESRISTNWQTPNDQEFRQAVNWLNIHAEKNAKLAFLDGSDFSISPLWLRPDIKFGTYASGLKFGGEYIVSINYYPKAPSDLNYALAARFLNPVYQLQVKGVPIVIIWKNDSAHVKAKYRNKLTS